MTTISSAIAKLSGRSNWASWKFNMEMVLKKELLWDLVDHNTLHDSPR
jgi:hypothetical protein